LFGKNNINIIRTLLCLYPFKKQLEQKKQIPRNQDVLEIPLYPFNKLYTTHMYTSSYSHTKNDVQM